MLIVSACDRSTLHCEPGTCFAKCAFANRLNICIGCAIRPCPCVDVDDQALGLAPVAVVHVMELEELGWTCVKP